MFRDDDPQARNNDVRSADSRGRELSNGQQDDTFSRHLDLPKGRERERITDYPLRGAETRALATVGAFRVIPQDDLNRGCGITARNVDRLRQEGLISTAPYLIGRRRTEIVTLTEKGLALLEEHRREAPVGNHQSFYSGVRRPRELAHDSRLFGAYLHARERLLAEGGTISRVRLEHELRREYQQFLQEPNRGKHRALGPPRRDREAVAEWAAERNLPVIDGSVRFPDLRIEYERPDGTRSREDVEIVTENYRGAHAASTAAAGFRCYRYSTRTGGAGTSAGGGRAREPRLAEDMWK